MKKSPFVAAGIFAVLGSFALLSLSGCGLLFEAGTREADRKEHLSVTVLQDPVGGKYVNTVSAVYQVQYTLDPAYHSDTISYRPAIGVDLEVYITNDKGDQHSKQSIHFDSTSVGGGNLTVSFSAPAGLYLDKTFWAEFFWSDNDGAHQLESKKAICTVN